MVKKNSRNPLYVDYWRLNSITEDSIKLLPVIHEVLKDLVSVTIFSILDLRKVLAGFMQDCCMHYLMYSYTSVAEPTLYYIWPKYSSVSSRTA
jgi:hypothetical protein